MQLHPGKKIQIELKDKGWTQRQFAFLLGKKVSEVNELIKGKRNITVQWDILLSHVLGTNRKYWLDLQNEYEYSLIESDFDLSKLPNFKDEHGSISINIDKDPEEKDHQISEQEENKSSTSSPPSSPASFTKEHNLAGREIEKKEVKSASDHKDNLHKERKTNKDVDISKAQEKHPKIDGLKSTKIDQNRSKLEKINKEGQEKKDKNNRQKIYNPNDKFDSYFPKHNKDQKRSKLIKIDQYGKPQKLDSDTKTIASKGKEKNNGNIETLQHGNNIHKHKEHIFRNF